MKGVLVGLLHFQGQGEGVNWNIIVKNICHIRNVPEHLDTLSFREKWRGGVR